MPVSSTANNAEESVAARRTVTAPPAAVNLTVLSTRLSASALICSGCPTTPTGRLRRQQVELQPCLLRPRSLRFSQATRERCQVEPLRVRAGQAGLDAREL